MNHARLIAHIKWLLNKGSDGVCLLGTTGEANSFSLEERIEVIYKVIEGGIDPSKLLVGTGSCAYTDTVTLTHHAVNMEVGGILMLPPFYYKNLSDKAVLDYFDLVIRKVNDPNLKIYLYHFPKMTGVPFTLSLTKKLADSHPEHIVGMKDSGGEWNHMKEIMGHLPGFRLFAGTERYLLENLRNGGAGTISASANATSSLCRLVYHQWKENHADVASTQQDLTEIRTILESTPFVGGLKALFAQWTSDQSWLNVRPPNAIIENDVRGAITDRLRKANFIIPV